LSFRAILFSKNMLDERTTRLRRPRLPSSPRGFAGLGAHRNSSEGG
jgi:hypothetical protein